MRLSDIAARYRQTDPLDFMKFLKCLAERTESGNSSALNLNECRAWGFPDDISLPIVLLLVEAGILEQKIRKYDVELDISRELSPESICDIDQMSPDEITFWYVPSLDANEFSSFLCEVAAEKMNSAAERPLQEQGISGAAVLNIQGDCHIHQGNEVDVRSSGDIAGVAGSTVIGCSASDSAQKTATSKPVNYGLICSSILFVIAVLAGLLVGSFAAGYPVISRGVRIVISFFMALVLHYSGGMAKLTGKIPWSEGSNFETGGVIAATLVFMATLEALAWP